MSKTSPARKARRKTVGKTPKVAPAPRRNFTPQETLELQEMQRTVSARQWEAAHIAGNTALIPDGQKVAAQTAAIAALLENGSRAWISAKLQECGYGNGVKCSINLNTGEILLEAQPA